MNAILYAFFLFCVTLLLGYRSRQKLDKAAAKTKTILQNEENRFNLLASQEKALNEKNKNLEHELGETITIYEYIKNLGTTIDFFEAITILQRTLSALVKFERGTLLLLENGNVSSIYDLYPVVEKGPETRSLDIKLYEKDIVDKLLKERHFLLYDKEKLQSIENIPLFINNLMVLPLWAEGELVSCLCLFNLPFENIDKIQFIAAHFALEVKKTQLYKKIKDLSVIDSLTGLYLRRYFRELFLNELQRCYRQKEPISLVILDIDLFKHYNDEHGHMAGDFILKEISSVLRRSTREIDILTRYGGDEFALVLPKTGLKAAELVAERLRLGINSHLIHIQRTTLRTTASIGVAVCGEMKNTETGADSILIDLADSALYKAKSQGRNRVVVLSYS